MRFHTGALESSVTPLESSEVVTLDTQIEWSDYTGPSRALLPVTLDSSGVTLDLRA